MARLRPTMQERVVQFGPERGLVGILTLPATAVVAPHVVLLNSGVIHRVGSNRIYVELARALATAGITVLRFDLSGIGDSRRRTDVSSVRESVERDIADAIEYLASTRGSDQVVLMGLCSGAFDALTSAINQPRVIGAFMVDIPGPFQGWRHTLRHIAARLFRQASWRNPLRSLVGHSRKLVTADARNGSSNGRYVVGARGTASRARMQDQLDALLARGVRLHFTFTAGLEENYNHPSQFRSTFPRAARHQSLSYDFFEERDHSFSTRDMRDRLVHRAVAWVLGGQLQRKAS
ncbi:MAG: alpha/beta fold hydrolase [Gemmatimonadaceae bacterium]